MPSAFRQRVSAFLQRGDVRARFYSSLPERPRILELGCGSGLNLQTLRQFRPELEAYGVDIFEPAEAPSILRDYKRVDLNAGSLPFPDGYFDGILFCHVIEHLERPLAVGPEVMRTLKPGGRIYVEAPNWTSMLVPSFSFENSQFNPFNFFDDPTHFRPWTQHSLFCFVKQSCGLNVLSSGVVRNWRRLPVDLLVALRGLVRRERGEVVRAVWNISGWSAYSIGEKTPGKI